MSVHGGIVQPDQFIPFNRLVNCFSHERIQTGAFGCSLIDLLNSFFQQGNLLPDRFLLCLIRFFCQLTVPAFNALPLGFNCYFLAADQTGRLGDPLDHILRIIREGQIVLCDVCTICQQNRQFITDRKFGLLFGCIASENMTGNFAICHSIQNIVRGSPEFIQSAVQCNQPGCSRCTVRLGCSDIPQIFLQSLLMRFGKHAQLPEIVEIEKIRKP